LGEIRIKELSVLIISKPSKNHSVARTGGFLCDHLISFLKNENVEYIYQDRVFDFSENCDYEP
jgi:hypothetical protein